MAVGSAGAGYASRTTGRWHMRRGLPAAAGLLVLGLVLTAHILVPGPFERLRFAAFDAFQRASPRPYAASAGVRVVTIDDESLARYGQWPWPRATVAGLVRALQDFGAASIAFDVVFAEPDRSAPDSDRVLAAIFARGRIVTGFGLLPTANGARPARTASFATLGGDPAATVPGFAGSVPNLPMLEEAASGHGSFTVPAGRDQMVRRLPMLVQYEGELVPSLALEALRVAENDSTFRIRAERVRGVLTGYTLRVGDVELPLDKAGGLWLHHTGPVPERMIPAWRVLDAAAREEMRRQIEGSIVLIGTSAVGLADLRPTPLNPFEPGVNLHAAALEQVRQHDFLIRPAWAAGAELAVAAGLASLVSLLAALAPVRLAIPLAGLALAVVPGGSWLAFRSGTLLDPGLVLLAGAASFAAAVLVRYGVAERDASRLRTAFAQYLSPALVEQLARDPARLRLGGELREMSFLFTDLEGFTALTERLGAEALVGLLNAYLDGLSGVAFAHGGTVDKIVGDALHVMFNAPLDQPDHAGRAVRCALAMDAFACAFAEVRRREGIAFGATRIGVNTGEAVVGNFGGARRFDYTAHGDAINTAARLEAANKVLGTHILVARATADRAASELAGAVWFRPRGLLRLRGKASGTEVLEPMTTPDRPRERSEGEEGQDQPKPGQVVEELIEAE